MESEASVEAVLVGALGAMLDASFTTLEDLWVTMGAPVCLTFDTGRLFIFKDVPSFHLPLDVLTSSSVLRTVLWLVESRAMAENIRNGDNKILFRAYKGDVTLDSAEDTIRKALWVCVAHREGWVPVWSFLMNKYVEAVGEGRKVEINRVLDILKHFERQVFLTSPTC
jgi:hypothetical protein